MRELFEARSIAVIGASSRPGKVGHIILRNMITSNYSGDLYPINPNADEILGLKAYPDILAIPGPVEMAVIAVPNTAVPGVIDQAGKKGVKVAVIISAGFRETGPKGAELENLVGEIASKYGIRILGPNCLGIISTRNNINATFTNNFPLEGNVAVMSQSGAMGTILLDWAKGTKIGFSQFISVGNKLDIDESDLLEYLRDDDDTKVIGMYVEGMRRGKKFIEQATATSRCKPIIALKSGRTTTGAKAASSHTGALSGSDNVYSAAMSESSVLRVKTLDEFFDLLQAFANMPLPRGDRVAIVTNAGGLGVMAADACSDYGLTMTSFSKETVDKMREGLPEEASLYNPVDVIGDADAPRFELALRSVLNDPGVDCVLAMVAPTDLLDVTELANMLATYAGKTDMPLVAAWVGGAGMSTGSAVLKEAGIPNYESPDRAVRALAAMAWYQEMKNISDYGTAPLIERDLYKVKKVLEMVESEDRNTLSETEGKEILQAYGIRVPLTGLAHSADNAAELASQIGFPVVLKISSPDIAHKTDVGGVVVNLKDEEQVRREYETMMARIRSTLPDVRIDGITVENMFSGREVIIGMVRDEQFGPVITFGLGGIFVEILRDVSHAIAPLSEYRVDKMIRSIRAYPILAGARGRKRADVSALKDTLFRVAQIAIDFPQIIEFEINPVMVGDEGQGCGAVDALAIIRRDK
ncbi:MAG: CoA-binding protein [Euryarchaeota archaeon]|nr:CoA-binding protein [Euryarchaeota archaeon]